LDSSSGELNPDQKQFLLIAKNNVDRLNRLINDVLDFSKLEAKKIEFNMKLNDLTSVINEAVNTHKISAEQKGLKLNLEVKNEIPKLIFDSDRIIQVLINLMNNAIKFTDRGGIVVSLSFEDDRKNVKICVVDTGRGISPDDIPFLFQKFKQLEDINGRSTGGTGLGLAICKEIVDQHKGKIWIDSKLGIGSSFCFTLPV